VGDPDGFGRLPRRERLTGNRDFQAVFQQGARIERPSLIVLWKESDRARRVGFAVSRQMRSAVKRNRVRRRLREAYRVARGAEPTPGDLVIVARRPALTGPFEAIVRDLSGALGAIAERWRAGRPA
jgi:ribonuclease P protein component